MVVDRNPALNEPRSALYEDSANLSLNYSTIMDLNQSNYKDMGLTSAKMKGSSYK